MSGSKLVLVAARYSLSERRRWESVHIRLSGLTEGTVPKRQSLGPHLAGQKRMVCPKGSAEERQ